MTESFSKSVKKIEKEIEKFTNWDFIHFCLNGDIVNAKTLVDRFDINIHFKDDLAFYYACANGHLNIVKWLYSLGGIDIHAENEYAFCTSCTSGNLPLVQWLYSLGDIDISDSEIISTVRDHSPDHVIEWFNSLISA